MLFTELPEIVPFSFGGKAINQGQFAQLPCQKLEDDGKEVDHCHRWQGPP